MVIWGLISMYRSKKELRLEREEWESSKMVGSVSDAQSMEKPTSVDVPASSNDPANANGAPIAHNGGEPDLEAGRRAA